MQASLASVDDLAVLMRTSFTGDAEEQAELLLKIASAWARGIAHRLWATTEDIPAMKRDTVVGIILAAVRRELRNPSRATYEVHGPDSAAYNIAACPPGFFTDEECKFLLACKGGTGSWWVMDTYRDEAETTAGYLYSATTSKPFPMYAPNDTEGWGNSYQL